MARTTILPGDTVAVRHHKNIPVRYRGRTARVVKVIKNGKRVVLDFSPRRATPLEVSVRSIDLL